MKTIKLLLIALSFVSSATIATEISTRIIGGDEVLNPVSKYPSMVSIYKPNSYFFCGGTLIARNWVITHVHR
ncbi:MAG TPA: trypsin-like serine protease [Psychromonas hadalis]|nr:trypsin-like serine protease [Psychromonas hadalis]